MNRSQTAASLRPRGSREVETEHFRPFPRESEDEIETADQINWIKLCQQIT